MKISVMITTRDRMEDLARSCEVLASCKPAPDEILICADGCQDETAGMIRERFPNIRLYVNAKPEGSVPSRDRMLREAEGDIVVSLDDDSHPADLDFFARIQELFHEHPEAAVIALPEVRDNTTSGHFKGPEIPGHYVAAYPNCAAAMRRDAYLRSPGYPPFFTHMYEEPDYALQCYAAGNAVWFDPRLAIRHHVSSASRHHLARHHQNARNELWSVWMRCPWPWLPLVSAFRVWRQFRFACSAGLSWAIREPQWWVRAIGGLGQCAGRRHPVPWRVYYAWMRLARESPHRGKVTPQIFPKKGSPSSETKTT